MHFCKPFYHEGSEGVATTATTVGHIHGYPYGRFLGGGGPMLFWVLLFLSKILFRAGGGCYSFSKSPSKGRSCSPNTISKPLHYSFPPSFGTECEVSGDHGPSLFGIQHWAQFRIRTLNFKYEAIAASYQYPSPEFLLNDVSPLVEQHGVLPVLCCVQDKNLEATAVVAREASPLPEPRHLAIGCRAGWVVRNCCL